jgi:CHAT domain-containing protein
MPTFACLAISDYLPHLRAGFIALADHTPKANPPLLVANPTFDKPGTNAVQIASADRSNLRSGDLATLKFGPLPATAIEGETIAKLLPNSRLFTQAQATETVVKSSNNPRILATHDFFLKPAPTTQAKDGSYRVKILCCVPG